MSIGQGPALACALGATLVLAPAPGRADELPWGGSVDGGASGAGTRRAAFEPDTERRLTGEDLVARGATTLADALDLIPEISVRAAGRGGLQADVRGARKSWLKILVDGVPVDDPYYGNFDLSSIPATDIIEIRVALAPASPLDGPGGPGGVIEVLTLRAHGADRLAARAQASDAPDANGWVGARTSIFSNLGVRLSGGGTWGGRDYDVTMTDGSRARLGQGTRQVSGSLRLESRSAGGDLGLDVFLQHRRYALPPSEEVGADVLLVDGEDSLRLGAWGETWARGWRLRGQAHAQVLERESRGFADASMAMLTTREALAADREGVALLGNRGVGPGLELVLAGYFDSEQARVTNLVDRVQGGRAGVGEAAVGLKWRAGPLRADAAFGVSAPTGAAPWPEAKLRVGWRPREGLDLEVVGAHKGRVPTLRERYQLANGNAALDPERSSSLDVRVSARPVPWLELDTTGYVRAVAGYIRLDLATGKLANLGRLSFVGGEASAHVRPLDALGLGASWSYERARAEDTGDEPLDFLPHHRGDAWLKVRLGARVSAEGRVRYVDRRLDQQQVLPAYLTSDLSGSWMVRTGLRATVRVDNLLDRRFEVRAHGYRDPGRVVVLVVEAVWP
jgi:outer membrane receptor protein involved in Fe transport